MNSHFIITSGAWRSLVAHCNGVAGVGGSNPLAPTNDNEQFHNASPCPLWQKQRPSTLRLAFVCLLLLSGGCGSEKTAQQAFETGDYDAAYKLFRPRAEAGDLEAQNYLGVHYYLGLGVRRDWQQALQWYDKAARQGEPRAQLNYGLMFQNGYGTAPDIGAAFMWYYASYRQGNRAAKRYMDTLAVDNLLSPNQIDYAKVRAKPYITNPVVLEQGTEGSLFRTRPTSANY